MSVLATWSTKHDGVKDDYASPGNEERPVLL
jgi:hypothetical protein